MNPNSSEYLNTAYYQQPRRDRRPLLILLIVTLAVIILGLVVINLLSRPFVSVNVPDGVTSVQFERDDSDGTVVRTDVTESSTVRLPVGEYVITTYKNKQASGILQATVRRAFSQSITPTVASPSGGLQTVMHQHADLVSPLEKGYVYVDNVTRAVFYTDSTRTINISDKLLLSQVDEHDPTFSGAYNTVIAMQQASDGTLLVTTTTAVFMVRSVSSFVRLPSSDKAALNYTSSSYDAATNRIFLLAADNRQVYYYDLNKPADQPKALTKLSGYANRIVSGGGKVAVVFDDLPSVEPAVLAAYSTAQVLSPVIIDGRNGQIINTLESVQGVTELALSGNGQYLLVKKKFATMMTIYDLRSGTSFNAAASDTHTFAWQGEVLYMARRDGLWSMHLGKNDQSFELVATSDNPIIRLHIAGNRILAMTNAYFISEVVLKPNTAQTPAEGLRKLNLQSDAYFIAFTTSGTQTHFDIETKGNSKAFDDAAIARAKASEFDAGRRVIQSYLGQSGNTVSARDTAITTPYENALRPRD